MALTTARGQAKSDNPVSRRMERLTEEVLLLKEELRLTWSTDSFVHRIIP
jgi:hypothetical protein